MGLWQLYGERKCERLFIASDAGAEQRIVEGHRNVLTVVERLGARRHEMHGKSATLPTTGVGFRRMKRLTVVKHDAARGKFDDDSRRGVDLIAGVEQHV